MQCSNCHDKRVCFASVQSVYCSKECGRAHFERLSRVDCAMHMRSAWQSVEQNTAPKELLFETVHMSGYCISMGAWERLDRETHPNATQFFLVVQGSGWSTIGTARDSIQAQSMFYVPPGVAHAVEAGREGLKMLTLYAPAEHETRVEK